jgi:hypothetical protein
MERHEIKARYEAQIAEWKANLDVMKAKAEASSGQAKVGYQESVAQLQKQLDDFKVQAAGKWDVADEKWDSTRKDLELGWQEWELRAKRAWNDLSK